MSKYTTELRYICEEAAGVNNHEEMYNNPGYNDTSQIIETARTKLFDFDYPIFDVNYKATLETKIIKHYYFREIGAESYGMFKMWLDRRMNEIMPYYNQLYQSELLKFNPFYNSEKAIQRDTLDTHDVSSENVSDGVAFRENRNTSNTVVDNDTHVTGHTDNDTTTNTSARHNEHESSNSHKDNDDTTTTNSHGENHSGTNLTRKDRTDEWTAYSDTPQGGLTGIKDNNYLTNITHHWHDPNSTDGSQIEDQTKYNENHEEHSGVHYVTNINGNDSRTMAESSTSDSSDINDVDIVGDTAFDSNTDSTSHGVDKTQTSTTNGGTEIYTGSGKYLEYVLGKEGTETYSEMLEKYRKTFLNIDMMVIDRLSDLFFNLW